MKLEIDFTNMMADAVGSRQGIRDEELQTAADHCRDLHALISMRRQEGELPFFNLPFEKEATAKIIELADELRQRFTTIVVLGIGGSALGTKAVMSALRPVWHNLVDDETRQDACRLFVLDNVDPETFAEHLQVFEPVDTCFLVISKSGSTVETTCQFLAARQWLTTEKQLDYRDHFVLITDPESGPLRELAEREKLRSCSIPPKVGGRFSVFTPVSLLPLACAGVDIGRLLAGAAALEPKVNHDDMFSNPAYLNGVLQYLAYQKGASISVMMPYSDRLFGLADWFRQLWAESLGKKHTLDGQVVHVGPTPVNALGTTDQHSQVQLYMEGPFDKVITMIAVESFERDFQLRGFEDTPAMNYLDGKSMAGLLTAERQATAAALARNLRPNCTLRVPDVSAETVGALLYLLQVQTLFSGYLFNVNPLDQPGVEEGKLFTYALMGRAGYDQKRQEYEKLQGQSPHRCLIVS